MTKILITGGAGLMQMYYVYLLASQNRSEKYIGSTNNLQTCLIKHNRGLITSTKRYRPWELIYYESYSTEDLARHREKQLKYHGNAKRELYKRLGLVKKSKTPTT